MARSGIQRRVPDIPDIHPAFRINPAAAGQRHQFCRFGFRVIRFHVINQFNHDRPLRPRQLHRRQPHRRTGTQNPAVHFRDVADRLVVVSKNCFQ